MSPPHAALAVFASASHALRHGPVSPALRRERTQSARSAAQASAHSDVGAGAPHFRVHVLRLSRHAVRAAL